MSEFKKLLVWEESHKLVLEIYKKTNEFPRRELYGLTSQLQRAAVSIPTNIVEGNSRRTKKDFLQFLYISRGSLEEVKYLLVIARDLKYLGENQYSKLIILCENVGRLLQGLIKNTKTRS